MIIRKGKNLRHYHICQGEGWISAEGRFTELPSSEIIIFLPYFQGVPHLRADDSRYWLSVFRKPVNEPCREFTNCGGFSKHKPENSGLCLTVSIAYSYEGFMCLGVSVIVRVHCISRTPWCLSTCYYKTSLPLWLILLGWWHSSQYTISRTLLPLFMPLFFLLEGSLLFLKTPVKYHCGPSSSIYSMSCCPHFMSADPGRGVMIMGK